MAKVTIGFDNRLETEVNAPGLKALRNLAPEKIRRLLIGHRRITCLNCGCERYTLCTCTHKA